MPLAYQVKGVIWEFQEFRALPEAQVCAVRRAMTAERVRLVRAVLLETVASQEMRMLAQAY